MNLPELVPVASTAAVTISSPIRHLCPFTDEADAGTVTITWTCRGATLELHSLAAWLDSFADQTISHEELPAAVADGLRTAAAESHPAFGDIVVTAVTARFTTAGIDVHTAHAVPDHPIGS